MLAGIDILGSGRVARLAVRLLARRRPTLALRLLTPRGTDPGDLSRAPLVIATSIDEGRFLASSSQWSRGALATPNLRWLLDRLAPRALAGRLVIVVTNPVEPIVDALARLEPTAIVVGFGLSVDRARLLEIAAVTMRSAELRVGGTHATGAIVRVARSCDLDPGRATAALRGYRSAFAHAPVSAGGVEALALAVERAPARRRERVLLEGGAQLLCDSEREGASPPARRGAIELARALAALAGGKPILTSTERGPCRLAITAQGAEVTRCA